MIKRSIDKNILLINILFITVIIVLFIKFFISIEFYPLHDETVIVERNTEWQNFIWRNYTSNHTINSFFAVITKSLFGYNLLYYRFFSFLCFVGILYLFKKLFSNIILFSLLIILILSSNILTNYIWIFRGYYVWAFLTVLNLYFLKLFLENNYNNKYFKIIMIVNLLLCCHALFVLYTVFPLLFYLSLIVIKNKDKEKLLIFLLWFLIPLISFYFVVVTLEGFAIIFWDSLNFNFVIKNILLIIKKSFVPGFKEIFLSEHFIQYSSDENIFLVSLKKMLNPPYKMEPEFTIITIYGFSILILFTKSILRKNNYLDLIFLTGIIFFYLIDKNPEPRQHIGIVYFQIFYIFDFLIIFLNKYEKNLNKVGIIFFFSSMLLIFTTQINDKFYDTKLSFDKIQKLKKNHDCVKLNELLNDYEIWLLKNSHIYNCKFYYDSANKKNILTN